MVNERGDILLEPQYPWIVFGDLLMAQIISMTPSKSVDGIDTWKMRIIPTKELAKIYNIPVESLDGNLAIGVEYPMNMIRHLSAHPAFSGYFSFLNYLGKECPETMTWNTKIEADKLNALHKIINLLKAENAYYREKLEIAVTNVQQYLKEFVTGPVEEISSKLFGGFQQQNNMAVSPVRNM